MNFIFYNMTFFVSSSDGIDSTLFPSIDNPLYESWVNMNDTYIFGIFRLYKSLFLAFVIKAKLIYIPTVYIYYQFKTT